MRRLVPFLCAAGLAAASTTAAADPGPTVETFEWSTSSSGARLGAMVIGITPELRKHFGAAGDRGVLVGRVEPKSAAEAAGLQVGDVIVEVRGSAIDSAGDVLSALVPAKQGDAVAITVIRDRRRVALQAKLTTPPMTSPSAAPRAGDEAARPRWFDDWLRDMGHRFLAPDRPDWFEEMFRRWDDPGLDPGGARSTRT